MFAISIFVNFSQISITLFSLFLLINSIWMVSPTASSPFCLHCRRFLQQRLHQNGVFYSTNKPSKQQQKSTAAGFDFTTGRHAMQLAKYTPDKIRNFAIIAHVDHGKSTLSDRLLQLTNVIPANAEAQYLDKLEVERERGITVKAQTCTMFYEGKMLNLIDTPGHVDFSFEVKRSMAACDGAILLVAANQGVQAQTIFNFWTAFEANLTILPVINKVDMPVDVDRVERQLKSLFDFCPDEILRISAKSGLNIPAVLDKIVEKVPAPKVAQDGHCLAHIVDSWFDHYKGAILLVIVKQGSLRRDMQIRCFTNADKEYTVADVGFLHPEMTPCESLNAGQVGFICCGIKSTKDVAVGDTIFESTIPPGEAKPFMEIKRIKPTVYSGLFPLETTDYERLRQAVESLCLNDSSVDVQPDSSTIFGQGWRLGFVGNLHMEVFGQRLEKEHGELAVFTHPSVEYLAEIVDNESVRKRRHNGQARIVMSKPSSYPQHPLDIERYLEPVSLVTIVTPAKYFEPIDALCEEHRGERVETSYIDEEQMVLKWRIPLIEVIVDFFDHLRRISSGYASFDLKEDGYKECKLEKINIHINDKPIEEMSMIFPASVAHQKAKRIVEMLKDEIPRQQFEVVIKACLGYSKRSIAQTVLRPLKKDFSGVLKGNFKADRLGKKLRHQAEGKEKMKLFGNVQIPRQAFLNVVRK